MHKKKLIAFLLISFSVILLFNKNDKNKNQPDPKAYTVTNGTIVERIDAIGVIASKNTVEVGTQVSGDITSVYVSLGDNVVKDQLMMEIDPTISQNELQTSKNNLFTLKSELDLKKELLNHHKKKLVRSKELYKAGTLSQEKLEEQIITVKQSELDVKIKKLEVKNAEYDVDSARTLLKYTTIRSPINGKIVSISGEKGQTLVSTQKVSNLLKISDVNSLHVKVPISEHEISGLHEGALVEFYLPSSVGERKESYIRNIELLPNKRTDNAIFYNAYFDIPKSMSEEFKLGMSVTASIIKKRSLPNAIIVPNQYIYNDSHGKNYVRKIVGNDIHHVVVEVGMKNFLNSSIISGLELGDELII